jgi:excisionase family DNA binding protein
MRSYRATGFSVVYSACTAPGDILTPEQVAAYLQLNTDTVYRLIRQRSLTATRIGRTYRIPRQDLEAFIATNSARAEVRPAQFERVLFLPASPSDRSRQEL